MVDEFTHFDAVEAYGSRLSVAPGETLGLHVRCTMPTYRLEVRRVSGVTTDADAPVVWSAADLPGVDHPTPADADSNGCGWPVSVEIPVGADWPSGAYLVTLVADGAPAERATAHAFFAVRAARPTARILMVLATNTYNAYNAWGGRSLYTGGRRVSFDRPFIRGLLARPDDGDEDRKSPPCPPGQTPDIDGDRYVAYRTPRHYPPSVGSSGWHTYERRFAQWAAAQGIGLDFAVSQDLAEVPGLTDGYPLVIGVGHDEYWSKPQRDAIEAYVRGGGHYASFSGNTIFWQVRFDDTGRHMTAFKYAAHRDDPVVGTADERSMSGMWCDPLVGRPEWEFLGAGSAYGLYARFGWSVPRSPGGFTVYRDTHWMFEGTGARYGDLIGAVHGSVGYETVGVRLGIDEYGLPISVTPGAPPTEIVAWAPASNLGDGDYPAGSVSFTGNEQVDLDFVAARLYGDTSADSRARVRHGNAVMLTCRPFHEVEGSGEVAVIGTTDWVFGLADPVVSRITSNILCRYTA